MKRNATSLLVLALLGLAADWPQWRGPDRNGISKEKGLLKTWPKEGPKLAWTFDKAGTGYSSPVVVNGKVYVLGAREEVEYVIALDATGAELWASKIGPMFDFKGNAWSGGPNAAPVVDGDSIYALGSQGIVVCVDLAKGAERWRVDMPKELEAVVDPTGGGPGGWGFSSAPLIDGDNLIVTPGGPKGLFAALNKNKGTVVWRSAKAIDPTTYSAPMAATLGGVPQYVAMVQNGAVGVSAKDGSLLWEHRLGTPYPDVVCAMPLVRGDLVYLTVGYGAGAELLKMSAKADQFTVESVYRLKEIGNKQGGVVLVDGRVYGFHDKRSWMCQDFVTGKIVWESPRRALGAGSMVCADGRLYCVMEDKGIVAMLSATPTKYQELSKFVLPRQSTFQATKVNGKTWTHPIIADGKLYVRDHELLFCYEVK